jgi:hypothetical protein
MGQITSHRKSATRYTALRFVGVIFTGLGAILLAAGGLFLVFGLHALLSSSMDQPPSGEGPFLGHQVKNAPFPGGLGGALPILWASALLVSGLQFVAMGSLIRLVINVEENTRIAAQCLEKLRSRGDSPIEQHIGSLFGS